MKTPRIAVWIGAVSLATAGAATARAQGVSGDLAKIQGHWWARVHPAGGGASIVQFMDIRGDVVTGSNQDDPDARSVGKIKLGESATPRTIGFLDTVANNKSFKDIKFPNMVGIYETDGQTLKIALNTGILNSKRPTEFKFDYKVGISVVTYRRGEPTPEEMPKTAARPALRKPKLADFAGVRVVRVNRGQLLLRTSDGQQLTSKAMVARALDASGNATRSDALFVPGNILDVTVSYYDDPLKADMLAVARLVRGMLDPKTPEGQAAAAKKRHVTYLPDPEGPGAFYKGAMIAKVEPMKVTLDVDGQTVVIGRTNANTAAFDLQGQQLAVGQQARLLKVGNTVDVDVRPKRNPNNPMEMPIIRSIRLLRGSLADPVEYLNSPRPRP